MLVDTWNMPRARRARAQLAQGGQSHLHEQLRLIREEREQLARTHVGHDRRGTQQCAYHEEIRAVQQDLRDLAHADPHAAAQLCACGVQRQRTGAPGAGPREIGGSTATMRDLPQDLRARPARGERVEAKPRLDERTVSIVPPIQAASCAPPRKVRSCSPCSTAWKMRSGNVNTNASTTTANGPPSAGH